LVPERSICTLMICFSMNIKDERWTSLQVAVRMGWDIYHISSQLWSSPHWAEKVLRWLTNQLDTECNTI
jgi:hypothetical protein